MSPPIKRELIKVPLRLRKDQMIRLTLLRAALRDKMGTELSMSELIEKAVDDFLESKAR